jgi:ribosomal protein S18 acetylase RimI-like enzyme
MRFVRRENAFLKSSGVVWTPFVYTTTTMPFFRRSLDPRRSALRPATPADLVAITRLLRESAHRFAGYTAGELGPLLAGAPAVVLDAGDALWGAAVAGWPSGPACWLRLLALADDLPVAAGLERLLPPLEDALRARGVARLYYAGDAAADAWLVPALGARGFRWDTEVVVYEKLTFDTPAEGNPAARVRRAMPVDLPAVLAIDAAAFAPEWVKDEGILGPALASAPYFVVAELAGEPAGYAFATRHVQGEVVHLVRIATHPAVRGQGIGVRLLADVVAFARRAGAGRITLNTQIDNATAQRLYTWFGFRRTGERQPVLRREL